MTKFKFITGSAVALALVATAVTPAFARGGGWGGYRHHRHHDRIDAGDVITGIFLISAIAAISGGSKRAKREREQRRAENNYPRDEESNGARFAKISNENDAVNACARAAEDRAGEASSVRRISTVRADGDGWNVDGVIEQRDTWQDRTARERNFSCSVRFGRVESVNMGSDSDA
jgi:hypothetical protein